MKLSHHLPLLCLTFLFAACQGSGGKDSSPISVGAVMNCDGQRSLMASGTEQGLALACRGSESLQALESILPENSGLQVSFSGEEVRIAADSSAAAGVYTVRVNNFGAINEYEVEVVENEISCTIPSIGSHSPGFLDLRTVCSHAQGLDLNFELTPGQNFSPIDVRIDNSTHLVYSGTGQISVQIKASSSQELFSEYKVINLNLNIAQGWR
jgi:hypothetical protein